VYETLQTFTARKGKVAVFNITATLTLSRSFRIHVVL